MIDDKRLQKLQATQDWEINQPATDAEWADDTKVESLDLKSDYELAEMLTSHTQKAPKVQKDLDKFTNFPGAIRFELTEQFTEMFEEQQNPTRLEGKTLQEWMDEEFDNQQLMYTWKISKLYQSIERIAKEIELRENKKVVREVLI